MFIKHGVEPIFSDYIMGHKNYSSPANYEPNSDEHQHILAALLGDGCLIKPYKKSKTYRMVWNMGNKSHALHKAEAFKFLGAKYQKKVNPGFGAEWHCVVTGCHPLLDMYSEKYGNSKGLTSGSGIASELNSLGWAVYYGDDGHLDRVTGTCFLHTEGLEDDMVSDIAKAVNEFIGHDAAVVFSYVGGAKKRKMKCIRIKKNGSKIFMEKIKKHMAAGMEYKIL